MKRGIRATAAIKSRKIVSPTSFDRPIFREYVYLSIDKLINNFPFFGYLFNARNKILEFYFLYREKDSYITLLTILLQGTIYSVHFDQSINGVARGTETSRIEVVTRSSFLKINRFEFSAQAQLWKSVNLKWRELERPCHFSILLPPTCKPWISISLLPPPLGIQVYLFLSFVHTFLYDIAERKKKEKRKEISSNNFVFPSSNNFGSI